MKGGDFHMTPWGPIGTPPPELQGRIDAESRFEEAYTTATGLVAALALQKALGEHRLMPTAVEESLEDWHGRHQQNIARYRASKGRLDYSDYKGQLGVDEAFLLEAEACVQEALDMLPKSPGE